MQEAIVGWLKKIVFINEKNCVNIGIILLGFVFAGIIGEYN